MLSDDEIKRLLTIDEARKTIETGVLLVPGGLYLKESVLGLGHSGTVYKGQFCELREGLLVKVPVAIKEMNKVDLLLLEREHDCLKKVFPDGHHALIEDKSTVSLIMPFIVGETLSGFIKVTQALSVEDRLKMIISLFEHLALCHEQGIVHLDLNAQNIVLNIKTHMARIIDFGCAKKVGEFIRFKNLEPMLFDCEFPPEYFSGDRTSANMDCYSMTIRLAQILGCDKLTLTLRRIEQVFEILPDPMDLKADVLVALEQKGGLLEALYHPRLRSKWHLPIVKDFLITFANTEYDFSIYEQVLDKQLIDMLNGLQSKDPKTRLGTMECLKILGDCLKRAKTLKNAEKPYSKLEPILKPSKSDSIGKKIQSMNGLDFRMRFSQKSTRMPLSSLGAIGEDEEEDNLAVSP